MKVEKLLKYVACFETRDTWKQAHFLHIFPRQGRMRNECFMLVSLMQY